MASVIITQHNPLYQVCFSSKFWLKFSDLKFLLNTVLLCENSTFVDSICRNIFGFIDASFFLLFPFFHFSVKCGNKGETEKTVIPWYELHVAASLSFSLLMHLRRMKDSISSTIRYRDPLVVHCFFLPASSTLCVEREWETAYAWASIASIHFSRRFGQERKTVYHVHVVGVSYDFKALIPLVLKRRLSHRLISLSCFQQNDWTFACVPLPPCTPRQSAYKRPGILLKSRSCFTIAIGNNQDLQAAATDEEKPRTLDYLIDLINRRLIEEKLKKKLTEFLTRLFGR